MKGQHSIFCNANEGVMHFRNGTKAFLMVEPESSNPCANDKDSTNYRVRYESGWYASYRADGVRIRAGWILKKDGSREEVVGTTGRDVIRFEPMSYREGRAAYPGIACEILP